MLSDAIIALRRKWITLLRSNAMKQTTGSLYKHSLTYGQGPLLDHYGTHREGTDRFCCLGVARTCVDDGPAFLIKVQGTTSEDYDRTEDYSTVEAEFELSKKMTAYLMAMNDGQGVYLVSNGGRWSLTSFPRSRDDFRSDTRIIRKTTSTRDFEFIARFIEILTALESRDVRT